nr:unnamed protein product [Digitaria exilis]
MSKCQAQAVAGFNNCYASCTSQSSSNCTCDNPNASYCCKGCGSAISSAYSDCQRGYGGAYVYYCMVSCTNNCFKTCP